MDRAEGTTWIVLGRERDHVAAVHLDAGGAEVQRHRLPREQLAPWIASEEAGAGVRWVWSDAARWYPQLLAGGVRVSRCHDLRLCHGILRDSARVASADGLRAAVEWDAGPSAEETLAAPALFEMGDGTGSPGGPPDDLEAAIEEFARQRAATEGSGDPARLRLLLAAESAGALIAVELRAAGLPWDAATHDAILTEVLGERPAAGGVPSRLEDARRRVRIALGDPAASLDSQPKLLRALHRVGLLVESTSRWQLAEHRHPVVEPLLEYKKLSRLMSANGWSWLEEWVSDGRFRPVYVPGGVVTGRWASSGGGALQIPRRLRKAVRADSGWRLVIADVAQLEPRVLAAMAGDTGLAEAARGKDLYEGIVATGAVASRSEAKVAMLGAMYGATTGDSGRLVPRLRRAFPRAMTLVDDAARIGENGGVVTTWLGRSSPPPPSTWHGVQARAGDVSATDADETRARRWARERGRFTRNFVVQGTAAEWALAWMADLRGRLEKIAPVSPMNAAVRSGPVFSVRPHLAFFLHDEVIVHVPADRADETAAAVAGAAAAAGRLLFGGFPIDFPLELRIAENAQEY